MIDAVTVFPELATAKEPYLCISSYQPIIDALGTVALQVDDHDYQGDSRILYKNPDGKIGLYIFGWGSCSGCDALQACNNKDEVQRLIDQMEREVKWFDTPSAAISYIENKDWKGEWRWNSDETKQFLEQALTYLKGIGA